MCLENSRILNKYYMCTVVCLYNIEVDGWNLEGSAFLFELVDVSYGERGGGREECV